MDKKKTILVVDDMIDIRDLLKRDLEKTGYNVMVAGNGKTALKYAVGKNPPDLIILDLMMPRMDGYEVMRLLRASDITKGIPIILLTGKTDMNDTVKGSAIGADDYITKPYKFEGLLRKIKRLIGQEQDIWKNTVKDLAEKLLVDT